ncbi:hypothetical protein BHE90_015227 [Fusarium euwallaceae]|uniref:Global transcription regulator sge1 n=1 Tax=Fusarium euwallaceae TaxID=1147111 RepID=A0A430L3W3_9HYPO|nr:hypothetical protein BHE90_015227 [Fusarium euwallaceae]
MSCALASTFDGYIRTTYDALIVFEACLSGQLRRAPRRPKDDERQELIQSGKVFIYKEQSSFKRWTDGVTWSPSRILDNFLVYRELNRSLGTGSKRKTIKKGKRMGTGAISKPQSPLNTNNEDRQLIGSLVDSYDFKQDGLVKKTIKIIFQEEAYHLVCYYKCDDIKTGLHITPSQHPMLQSIIPRNELMVQAFKTPIFEDTRGDGINNHSYGQAQMNYNCVIPQGGIPIDYSFGRMDLSYAYQQPLLAHPQHELLQCRVPSLPYYSEEQQGAS